MSESSGQIHRLWHPISGTHLLDPSHLLLHRESGIIPACRQASRNVIGFSHDIMRQGGYRHVFRVVNFDGEFGADPSNRHDCHDCSGGSGGRDAREDQGHNQ